MWGSAASVEAATRVVHYVPQALEYVISDPPLCEYSRRLAIDMRHISRLNPKKRRLGQAVYSAMGYLVPTWRDFSRGATSRFSLP